MLTMTSAKIRLFIKLTLLCPFLFETNFSKEKYYLVSCNEALGKNTLSDRRHSVGALIKLFVRQLVLV